MPTAVEETPELVLHVQAEIGTTSSMVGLCQR